jgi:protein gp37
MKPKFNRTNKNVDWARWTWNPVYGCKHGCEYCYARDIDKRFFGGRFDEPRLYEERLNAPFNTPLPETDDIWDKLVFVCSMSDLFGEWVPQGWIYKVLEVIAQAKDWTFCLLTKNPKRMTEFQFPLNVWVGATVDILSRTSVAEHALYETNAAVKFISCEPLLEAILR